MTSHRPEMVFRGRRMPGDRALVMAIVNRTPDSFYDKGATFADTAALEAVDRAVAAGADIVDIGGVKAGEGPEVDVDEESRRVVPFVAEVRRRHPGLVISVDTWRHEVGRQVCEAGADLLNDTWAGADPKLVEIAAEFGAGYVCSHVGGMPVRTDPYPEPTPERPFWPRYDDVVADVVAELTEAASRTVAAGVPRGGVLIDPTFDFGKSTRHGLELLRHFDRLVATGWPVLVALSNKDLIGETLDVEAHDRLAGTLAATAIAAHAGAAVFRAHNVRETREAVEAVAGLESVVD
ncbi:dihydropteroate synthase [Amycolatopsis mediterranei S699]|uniref:Dihydropteroate synthase n=3 Tax=Amycolatopsis mediterranei TaxID=33910 RepID=A0A0H3CXU7_AMYMU|nr:dihydropteroate synthase [Amycolatopsis mediterranei]ADJ43168.1 dihydropteroate synthase [Amycolatopsis mediterranei U32]AFO74882.1 dihydropteroate synthase [Amycolatopsis mediterranei S699]AGT82011.1 dihydropteroate synthase [Amycolatopsis mediterranei RB]KDO05079.1 dihydropteroate synthase [Amycolatopsis mediterranei]KDU90209.1 dihydropteroate synthase [Amycolatopsis mediterranei]